MTDLAVMLAASSVAGLQARRVMKMRRMPKLRLRVDPGAAPQRVRFGTRQVLVWMLKLVNTGAESARGCEALVERLEYFDGALWQAHPGFPFSLQLPWSGVGSTSRLNVAAGEMSCELPLVLTYMDEAKMRLVTPLVISSGMMLEYPPGHYRLTVSVRAAEGPESVTRHRFVLHFDGTPEGLKIEDVGAP
jgi:hypothetical protein